ncbi:MAG: hypothetical protein JSW61_15050 [Candidatus Thorarchaeota archaeon]|nr:MAG: hypothetical protein JSW61_15050 [Candidatus Thorarchaeota archaeon]
MRRADKVLIGAMIAIFIYWIAAISIPDISSPFTALYEWLTTVSEDIGYPGTLIGSFLGNATIVIPFPFVIIIFVQGSILDPTIVGIIAGIGALAGEMTGYVVGYGGGQFIKEESTNGFRRFAEMHPRALPLLIFILGLTPLPDDPLIVPLGAAKYPWYKIAIPSLCGKMLMLIGVAWAGFFGMEIVADLLGGGNPESFTSKTIEIIVLALVVLALYALVRIDWSRMTGGRFSVPSEPGQID